MKQHKWGKQSFLNPVDSRDDGWFKLGLEFSVSNRRLEINSKFCISDCSNKIELDFDISFWKQSFTKEDIDKAFKSIRERREKARLFKESIEEWYTEISKMYDAYERKLNKIAGTKKDEKS
jgi:hypothetical protein